jgi:hypothetical protein
MKGVARAATARAHIRRVVRPDLRHLDRRAAPLRPVLNDADYILGDGADTRVRLGVLCEIFLAITNIGTAVVP